ncbi:hypothetical protein V8C26DRAFT_424956 [Trichoderma gracile]
MSTGQDGFKDNRAGLSIEDDSPHRFSPTFSIPSLAAFSAYVALVVPRFGRMPRWRQSFPFLYRLLTVG